MACPLVLFGALSALALASSASAYASPRAPTNVSCPAEPLAPGTYEFSLEFDGLVRDFIVHVPRSYANVPTPLFLNFHGFTSSMTQQFSIAGMDIVSEEEGFIALVPDGYANSWNAGWCCGRAARDDLDDVGLTRAMVAFVQARTCVDPDRIFAAGYSNGGYMSFRLACEASDLIRAIGSNAGNLAPEIYFPCNQTKPVPVMHFHGTDDGVIPYNAGVATIERYTSEIVRCTDQPEETFRNGTASCVTWDQCAGGSEVTFCTIDGGGHFWPGCFAPVGCGGATYDINATREMWQFFVRMSGGLAGN